MRTLLSATIAGVAVLGLWTEADAWPAVQDGAGVHLCDSRPFQQPDGLWACRSGGVPFAGALVDVSRGPGGPYGTPPGVGPGPPPYGPYSGSPWGPPRRGPSGYDELDPWLGPRGPSDR